LIFPGHDFALFNPPTLHAFLASLRDVAFVIFGFWAAPLLLSTVVTHALRYLSLVVRFATARHLDAFFCKESAHAPRTRRPPAVIELHETSSRFQSIMRRARRQGIGRAPPRANPCARTLQRLVNQETEPAINQSLAIVARPFKQPAGQ
jgi:hypothetical protein